MAQPLVFVSYSHKDETEKDQLVAHLKVLQHAGLIDLWVDDRIEGGADWEAEIKQAMVRAKVAILLISANFLTSDFILGKEVPGFLERRQSKGLTVFPVIAKPCAWRAFKWLARMNVKPKNGRPVWGGDLDRVDADLTAIVEDIVGIINKEDVPDKRAATAPDSLAATAASPSPSFRSSQISDLEHVQTLIEEKKRRLYRLEIQKAQYGLSTPPEIHIQIEDLQQELEDLDQRYQALAN